MFLLPYHHCRCHLTVILLLSCRGNSVSQDEVWLVNEDDSDDFKFRADKVKVNTHPVPDKEGDPDGMYLLKRLPDGTRQF